MLCDKTHKGNGNVTKHANIRILTIVVLELKLYDGEDRIQGLQTVMKVDLRAVAFCEASRYGRAERGGVMLRRCFSDESAVSSKLQTKQHIEGL
ncbi:hypothetical protein YC2023_008035 [Brassica napus]